jgi:RNA recognition motif-containing protein
MEEDPSRQQAASIRDDIAALSSADEEFAAQELNYGQVSSAEDDEYEHQEWAGAASEKCNLIVNYLPHEIDDVTLKVRASTLSSCNMTSTTREVESDFFQYSFLSFQKTLFVEHGDIAVAKVVKDKISKKSLGYGFVKFLREEDAASAIESKNGFLMGHKKLKVSLARPPSTEIRNCKLYITNLPKEFTEKEVSELFSQVND